MAATLLVVLYFFIIKLTSAASTNADSCPAIQLMPTFDIKSIAGKWYEAARYDNNFQFLEHCVTVDFNTEAKTFSVVGVVNDKSTHFEGPISSAVNGSGILTFHSTAYTTSEKSDYIDVAILKMIPDKYMILYDCSYNDKLKEQHEFFWILVRDVNDTTNAKTGGVYLDYLKSLPFVNFSKFAWQDFSKKSCETIN